MSASRRAVAGCACVLVVLMIAATLAGLHRFSPEARADLPPLPLLVGATILSSLVLARCPAAFRYSPLLAGLVIVSLAAGVVVSADALFFEALEEGWRATALAASGLVAVILVLKLWAPLTGLPRMVAIAGAAARNGGEGTSDAGPLRILSWNVYLRSVASERITENDRKEVRAERLADPDLSPLRDADVVCLQEMCATANYRVHRLLDAAGAMGYSHAVLPARPPLLSPALVDSGLVILSRRPMRDLRSSVLRGGIGPDRFMAKRVDSVSLQGGVGLVHSHTQSGYTRVDLARFEEAKRRQLRQVAAAWGQSSRRDPCVVLCGDLNWDAREPGRHEELVGMLRKAGHTRVVDPLLGGAPGPKAEGQAAVPPEERPATVHVTYAANGQEAHVNFYPVLEASRRQGEVVVPRSIDYVLVGGRFREATAERTLPRERGQAMSDHHAIRAEVLLEEGKRA